MVSWHGCLCTNLARFWLNIRTFAYFHKTVFEILFIFLYAFEQIILIWLTFTAKNIGELGYIISLFAVIVLTTFALQKLVMESRIRVLETRLTWAEYEKANLETRHKNLKEEYVWFVDSVPQYLNKLNHQNKRR